MSTAATAGSERFVDDPSHHLLHGLAGRSCGLGRCVGGGRRRCHIGIGGGRSTGSSGGTSVGGGTRGSPVPGSGWGSMSASLSDGACASSAEGRRATWEPQMLRHHAAGVPRTSNSSSESGSARGCAARRPRASSSGVSIGRSTGCRLAKKTCRRPSPRACQGRGLLRSRLLDHHDRPPLRRLPAALVARRGYAPRLSAPTGPSLVDVPAGRASPAASGTAELDLKTRWESLTTYPRRPLRALPRTSGRHRRCRRKPLGAGRLFVHRP